MQTANIVREATDVNNRLSAHFSATVAEMQKVVHAAVAAKGDASIELPRNAGGLLSYIYGTGALRSIFVPKGYKINRSNNIESVYDPLKNIKIIFQNADSACDATRDPRSISENGPAAAKAVEFGQASLFPEFEEEDRKKEEEALREGTAAIWYFFVYIDGDDVRAELSRPKSIDENQFKGFHERIFILNPGDWTGVQLTEEDQNPAPQTFEINVTRK